MGFWTPNPEKKLRQAIHRWESRQKGYSEEEWEEVIAWTGPYEEVEERGIALLERRQRMLKGPLLDFSTAVEVELDNKPPAYKDKDTSNQDREQLAKTEAGRLLELYWESRATLNEMHLKQPKRMKGGIWDIIREDEDRDGRPYVWVMARARCADEGGCCGRDCRCCEKSRLTYNRPLPLEEGNSYSSMPSISSSEVPSAAKDLRLSTTLIRES
ncbi:hypothetical protein ASPCADRAFT_401342 [Aspergillus carbonarius ITEM 5010]|uniref:Uncharacterized protein n=1 Tax=Aspergillus carbonarius (strain ITEM 5010) TaxID=602072 RepID=A0A1R3S0S7_ASPC5|nr:hypothetical protein ASPCADRAFT_401342 [Aspergillus carbonarius ITEM 5010]